MPELQESRILFNVLLSCFVKCLPLALSSNCSDRISPYGVISLFLAWILEKNNISGQHTSTSLKPTFILVSVCQQQLYSYYCPFILHWSGAEDYKYLDLCSCVSVYLQNKTTHEQLIIFVLLKWKGEKQYGFNAFWHGQALA